MFTFPVEPHDLFAERGRQFANGWGIPWKIIRRVQSRVDDNWREGPGGWTYEWAMEAAASERKGQLMLAAMLYGAARFPVVATPMRQQALERQADCFERAARGVRGYFERRHVMLASAGGQRMPVHLYAAAAWGEQPLVLLSGGVDTGKMELHRIALMLARIGRFRVAAIDMPGTGESGVALTPHADGIYRELLGMLAPSGPKAILGVSFGGHWAAKLALQGAADAVIDLGGPAVVFDAEASYASTLPNGMAGIIANALRCPGMPSDEEIGALTRPFSLRGQGLLDGKNCAPLLVINGAQDQYIPQEDSTLFARYPGNQVWLMRGMTHCAAEGLPRIVPSMVAWLRLRLYGETFGTRLMFSLARRLLPARVAVNAP